MIDFIKDFRKVRNQKNIKNIINNYNRGLITLDECLHLIADTYHENGLKEARENQNND